MISTLELRFLGGLTILQAGQPLVALKSHKGQALLCYLALTGKAHTRPMLAGLLWPEMPEDNALMNLRKVLSKVKPDLGSHLTVTTQRIAFNREAAYWLDVTEFEAGLVAKEKIGRLQTAVALYQGDFLEGFYLDDAPEFEGWVLAQRAHLRQAALDALQHLVTHFAGRGIYETAVSYARQLLTIEPWQEEAHRELMHLLALSGQRSAALAQYECCRRLLRDELAVEPSPQTRALYERLARGEGAEAAAEDTAVPSEPGAASQISALERPRHNLPLQLSSFIGREWEVAEVGRLLTTSRLVTLTGAGGSGKTRLALQAAAHVLDNFADGVWLVELALLSEAALVPQTVASALDIGQVADQPPLTLLLNHLRARPLLLLLDNCEHVLEAAAQLADTLLRHCPHLHILATSREALNISGETAWLVPSLSLPEPGEQPPLATLKQADAVCLFVERATAVLPTFNLTDQNAAVVAQVCRQLDGMPLALELAAARVKLLRVEQIAARLDDRFRLLAGGSRTVLPRHQTLGALIDWSYDLLTPAEQHLLRWLAVFAGGFTLEAVEAVCADDSVDGTGRSGDRWRPATAGDGRPATAENGGDALELLAQLVNKSLVVAKRETGQEARYHLLETIRQYAWAKLVEGGEAEAAQSQHLAYFLQLAETAEPLLYSAEQRYWWERLETEYYNWQAALAWSLENPNGDLESGVRLAATLAQFWYMLQHLREGRRWVYVALDKRSSVTPPVRARLLSEAGWLWLTEMEGSAKALLEESLGLYRQLDDREGMARSLGWLGREAWRKGDLDTAASLFSEKLNLAEQVGAKFVMTTAYYDLTDLAVRKGDAGQAAELAARGIALTQESGDRWMYTNFLFRLGLSAALQRGYTRAAMCYQEGLALSRELKNRPQEARLLNALGEWARFQRAYEQAAAFYHESLAVYRNLKVEELKEGETIVLHNLGLVALGQGDWSQASSLFRESMALAKGKKDNYTCQFNLWGMGRLALAEGQTQRAAQLLAAAGQLLPIPLDPVDQEDTEHDIALARAQLGEEAFATAWAAGQAMSLEEAVAFALEEVKG